MACALHDEKFLWIWANYEINEIKSTIKILHMFKKYVHSM